MAQQDPCRLNTFLDDDRHKRTWRARAIVLQANAGTPIERQERLVQDVVDTCPTAVWIAMTDSELKFGVDDDEAKRRQIADIAYFSAERRGFSPGYELDDWLQAEQEVESTLEALEP